MNSDLELNRAAWDQLAALHGQDEYYDSGALVAGRDSLIEEEEAALVQALGHDLAGRRVLHLQCHLGFDAITFARRGAAVTGVDFSTVALGRAHELADRCDVQIDWVCAEATRLPPRLDRTFDLVWATIGVICWIGDIRAWMRSVARSLVEGGALVLIDGHPTSRSAKFDRVGPARNRAGPVRRVVQSGWDYATSARTGPQVQFNHSLGSIVTAAEEAGLRGIHVHEHTDLSCDLRIDHLRCEDDGRYRYRVNGDAVPVLFTLIASRAIMSGGTVEE